MVKIEKVVFYLAQEGTTNDYEEMTVELDSQTADISDGCFFILKTEGWSINEPSEMGEVFTQINNFKIGK